MPKDHNALMNFWAYSVIWSKMIQAKNVISFPACPYALYIF